MAIYAFDGTWNEDDDLDEVGQDDTNVARFLDACGVGSEEEVYVAGVGTRYSIFGKVIGGAIGVGGKKRIAAMLKQLQQNYKGGDDPDRDPPDEVIDIIGFSRGAALALQFANEINEFGLERRDRSHVAHPPIRFLGLWDVVGAFGLPLNIGFRFQEANPGYTLTVPDNVERCYHAMALDERREAFTVTRLNADRTRSNIEELWFRGVHSDVGGGNRNLRLSDIALKWMLEKADECGLPVDNDKLRAIKVDALQPAPLSKNLDILPDPARVVLDGDQYHSSAQARTLKTGETARFIVGAHEKFSWSGVKLEQGGRYRIWCQPGQTWSDGEIKCGPDGWTTEQMKDQLGWIKARLIDVASIRQRHTPANWFEVVGCLGKTEDTAFRIGNGGFRTDAFEAPRSDMLYAFANDLESKYDNNKGEVFVEVERVG